MRGSSGDVWAMRLTILLIAPIGFGATFSILLNNNKQRIYREVILPGLRTIDDVKQ
jgi:hypothetical protein